MDKVDSQSIFPRVGILKTRGEIFKMREAMFKWDVIAKFFTQIVVGAKNMLPGAMVEPDTIVSFKRHIDA